MAEPRGLMPPMITVFNADESINESGTRRFANFLVENGAHGVCPGGSTGEFIAMTLEERRRVVEIVTEEVHGRAIVYPGTGHYSTKLTIELCRHAESCGADGVMVVPPYYLLPTKPQIKDHYRRVKEAINIPIMLYNNPWYAGVELTPWEVAELVKEGVISSIKVAHGDAGRVHDLISLCGDKLTVMYGHDICALEGLLAGAKGWVSGLPNLIPGPARKLYDAVDRQDLAGARKIWYDMVPLVQFAEMPELKREGEPHWLCVVKAGLNMIGMDVGLPRKPLQDLSPEYKATLKRLLGQLGLL
jgi:4-hydroxy-tetrahydrodipicolinate synthase